MKISGFVSLSLYRTEKCYVCSLGAPLKQWEGEGAPALGGRDLPLQWFWVCRALWRSVLMRQFLLWSWETVTSLFTTKAGCRLGAGLAARSASSKPRPRLYPQVPPLGVCCKVVINLPATSAPLKASSSRCSQSPPDHFSVLTSSGRSFLPSFREYTCREL